MKWHIDQTKLFTHNKIVRQRTEYEEFYYLNGQYHNLNGPAIVSNHPCKKFERYCLYDKFHRIDGPAHISYYINGRRLTLSQFKATLRTQRMKDNHV